LFVIFFAETGKKQTSLLRRSKCFFRNVTNSEFFTVYRRYNWRVPIQIYST